MKKIMFYINAIHHGGAERVMVNLASEFVKNGNECVLVTSFTDSWEYSFDSRVKRISLFEKPLRNFIVRNIRLIANLRKVIKEENPDTILSFMAEPNFRSIIACCGLNVKRIISVRNDPNREYPNFLFRFFAKALFRFADHVVFQTEDAQRWFPKSIQQKSSVILNPVADEFFSTHFEGERHDIVTTGRLVSQKNHKLLIKAFAQIANMIEDNLYIYGEGELRQELETLISDLGLKNRVFLPGAVKNVADTIKSAKLFVLSSDYEGAPNSLMEAMALGIPCISTSCPCGGPRMLLNDDFLVDVNDDVQLGDKLLKVNDLRFFKDNYKINATVFHQHFIAKDWLKVLL